MYCFNNPLKYRDPSGLEVDLLEIASRLLASDYGGYWNPNSGISHPYTQDESDLYYEAYKCLTGYLGDRVWQFGYSGFSIDPTTVYKDKNGGIGFLAKYYWYDYGIAFNKSQQLSHIFNLNASGQGGNVSLYFDGNRLHIIDESTGRGVYNTIAYSGKGEGMNNPAFQNKADIGPIPEGNYSFTMDGIQTISTRNRILGMFGRGEWRGGTGSWGDTRVWLTGKSGQTEHIIPE